jgi:protein-tyrosine phosphatase
LVFISTLLAARTLASMSSQTVRRVTLETCHNFRDMGGYHTMTGRTVAVGRLYRADTLHRLTPADLQTIVDLGIQTVIDLRSRSELDQHGRVEVGEHDIAYHHLPMLDEVAGVDRPAPSLAADPPATLGEAYTRMLDVGTPAIAQAVRILAQGDTAPAVFHCMAGKDRTGILAAVVLGALDVPDDEIVADYVLTEETREARNAFLADHDPDYLVYLETLPSYALETKAESMREFLLRLRSEHGSIRSYLATNGVDAATVDRLAEALLSS